MDNEVRTTVSYTFLHWSLYYCFWFLSLLFLQPCHPLSRFFSCCCKLVSHTRVCPVLAPAGHPSLAALWGSYHKLSSSALTVATVVALPVSTDRENSACAALQHRLAIKNIWILKTFMTLIYPCIATLAVTPTTANSRDPIYKSCACTADGFGDVTD